jgi:preprotein translocase, secE subunit
LGVRVPLALPFKRLRMEKITNYIKLSRIELRKVIFPLKEQVRNAFITVFAVVAIVSLFLALVDVIMSYSLSNLI